MYFPDAEISFHAFRLEPSGQINVAAVEIKLPDGADERGTVDGWRQSKGWVPVDLQAGKLPSKSKAGVVLGFTRNGRAVVTYNGDCVYDGPVKPSKVLNGVKEAEEEVLVLISTRPLGNKNELWAASSADLLSGRWGKPSVL